MKFGVIPLFKYAYYNACSNFVDIMTSLLAYTACILNMWIGPVRCDYLSMF